MRRPGRTNVSDGRAGGNEPGMSEFREGTGEDFAEEAAEATEEARRAAGDEGRSLEDQAESGRVGAGDDEEERETAY